MRLALQLGKSNRPNHGVPTNNAIPSSLPLWQRHFDPNMTFDEAIAATARGSPTSFTRRSHNYPFILSRRVTASPYPHTPLPRFQNQPVDIRTAPDPSSSESLRYSTQAEYDSGSDDGDLEVISSSDVASSPSTSAWAQDHSRLPIHERSQLESGTAPS
ncbi:hypothetical protein B0F90DRAFT_597995 [Multifurca ochricompacta]|uniref:Uncharacterized protein n=1 Tax=Multifurca ochricompacta TaxID=376703 RepID=A0AAD4M4U0_9AGAM|nr:hypothetical protein B0F90DRAFT_597995 [Multifurca ochricompacta]